MVIDTRIWNRVDGYWPGYRMTPPAKKAWTHLLDAVATETILAALDDFAAEDHATPPRAGQLAARCKPPQPKTSDETEIERATRQRRQATQLVKDGQMTQRDFDWYQETYWSRHAA